MPRRSRRRGARRTPDRIDATGNSGYTAAAMSKSTVTKRRRQIRSKNAGKARKKTLAKEGSTPAFPIHVEKA